MQLSLGGCCCLHCCCCWLCEPLTASHHLHLQLLPQALQGGGRVLKLRPHVNMQTNTAAAAGEGRDQVTSCSISRSRVFGPLVPGTSTHTRTLCSHHRYLTPSELSHAHASHPPSGRPRLAPVPASRQQQPGHGRSRDTASWAAPTPVAGTTTATAAESRLPTPNTVRKGQPTLKTQPSSCARVANQRASQLMLVTSNAGTPADPPTHPPVPVAGGG